MIKDAEETANSALDDNTYNIKHFIASNFCACVCVHVPIF